MDRSFFKNVYFIMIKHREIHLCHFIHVIPIINVLIKNMYPFLPSENFSFCRAKERGDLVVERRTPNREVLGSIPTRVTVLCP